MKKVDEECSVDGSLCSWVSEKEYTPDGELVWDTYCEKCFRYKGL